MRRLQRFTATPHARREVERRARADAHRRRRQWRQALADQQLAAEIRIEIELMDLSTLVDRLELAIDAAGGWPAEGSE